MAGSWTEPKDFAGWLGHVFDRAVSAERWYHAATDENRWEPAREDFLGYLAQAFEGPQEAFGRFSDAQLDQGLHFLLDSGFSSDIFALKDPKIGWPKRQRALRSIGTLYRDCFAVRCTQTLAHLNEAGSPLNSACYVWWDLLPLRGEPEKAERKDLDQEIMKVLEETLEIAHVACQEAALHGLGHWASKYPERVSSVVGSFLERRKDARPELLEYARKAREGLVL